MQPKIKVEAAIKAPVEMVWQFFNNPFHIMQWNHASDDWHCPAAQNTLEVGHFFLATMAAKDGSFSFDFKGIYDEIIDNELIKYHMEDGRQVAVRFYDKGGLTYVTEEFDPENQNSTELQQAGWQAILTNFKEYVEQEVKA